MMQQMVQELNRQAETIASLQQKAQTTHAIRPPKPDTFEGRHCDTFIYSLEKLFAYYNENDNERRVALAVTFLRGSALRWYKCTERQDTARELKSWPTFIAALKAFFEAANTETLVRNKLANLRQLSSVAKYNDLFNSLIIEIVDLDARSKLDMYMRGLKQQVQLHVTLKEPSSLDEAQRLALNIDGILVETGYVKNSQPRDAPRFKHNKHSHRDRNNNRYGRSGNSSGSQNVPMELGQAEHEITEEDYEQDHDATVASAQSNYKGTQRLSAEEQKRMMREGRCFSCGETGHLSRDCTNRQRAHPKND
jgi:hypothetical protein